MDDFYLTEKPWRQARQALLIAAALIAVATPFTCSWLYVFYVSSIAPYTFTNFIQNWQREFTLAVSIVIVYAFAIRRVVPKSMLSFENGEVIALDHDDQATKIHDVIEIEIISRRRGVVAFYPDDMRIEKKTRISDCLRKYFYLLSGVAVKIKSPGKLYVFQSDRKFIEHIGNFENLFPMKEG